MGGERDSLTLFRAEPCGNIMLFFGSEQQVLQLSCASQLGWAWVQASCPRQVLRRCPRECQVMSGFTSL